MDNVVNIRLPEGHVELIKEYYRKRLNVVEKEVEEIKEVLEQLNGGNILKPDPSFYKSDPEYSTVGVYAKGYIQKWSNLKKAQFVIKEEGKPLTTGEIVDIVIHKYEPDLKNDRKRFVASVSSVLSSNCKEGGAFTRSKNESDNFVYDTVDKGN